jgi:CO/xanthine dehydrogenase Mo-binding subunit
VERHPSRRELRPRQPVRTWAESERVDALAKAEGTAAYLDDLPEPHGCLYAAAVRSPIPHARIRSIDTTAAERLPGVQGVLHRERRYGMDPTQPLGEDAGKVRSARGDLTVLTTDTVRFEGDLVGLVVARDLHTARAAAAAVQVDYEPLPHVSSFAEAMAPGAPRLHEQLPDNVAFKDELSWGDVDAGRSLAEHVFEEEFFGGHAFHRPLEPATSCLVVPEGDDLTVWASTAMPFSLRSDIARSLGLPVDAIRMRVPYIGGGFGAKKTVPALICTAAISRALGSPVKYLATDYDSFRATSRHAIAYKAEVGFDHEARLVFLDVDLEVDTGAYFTGARLVTHNACISAWGCYRVPHFRVRATAAYTNTVPAASFRATGKNQTTFGVECLMDAAAARLGVPPWELRKRNSLRMGEFVAERWRVRGTEYVADVPPMDTDFAALIDHARQGIGWAAGDSVADADARPDPDVLRGRGLALSLRHGTQGGGKAYAMVALDHRGQVTVHHNAPDLGTGVYNMMAVVASETLGVPRAQVRIGHPDTANGLPFVGTMAQRTTVEIGNAVKAACERLVHDLIDIAVEIYGGDPGEWSWAGARLSRGGRSYTIEELLAGARSTSPLSLRAVGSYGYAPSEDPAFGGLDHWAPGAAAAEVEIDSRTGQVRVLRYCAVADAGKAVHRTSSIRQVESGVIMGLGLALYEELRYGPDGLENGNGWGYRIATVADVPDQFRVVLVENGDGPGPFGAKGIAQTSLPCVTPAIGNAIRDALGRHIRVAPFTPERVLDALASGSGARDVTGGALAGSARP